jgi:hypothetical protein
MKESGTQESKLKGWALECILAVAWKMMTRIYGSEGPMQGPLTLLVKVISKHRKTVASAKGKMSIGYP